MKWNHAALLLLIVISLIGHSLGAPNLQLKMAAFICFALGATLVYRCLARLRPVAIQLKTLSNATILAMAAAVRAGPFVQFFVVAGIAFGTFATACGLLGYMTVAEPMYLACMVTLGIAGSVDTWQFSSRIWKSVWAPVVGKITAVTLGIALAAAALSFAKGATHSLTHIDPKYFSEFTTVLGALLLPIIYGFAASALLAIFATLQWLNLCLVSLIIYLCGKTEPFLPKNLRGKVMVWRYRVTRQLSPARTGSKKWEILQFHDTASLARPMALITVAVIMGMSFGSIIGWWPAVKPFAQRILVFMEYRNDSWCANGSRHPVAYMDENRISVAVATADGFRFEVHECRNIP